MYSALHALRSKFKVLFGMTIDIIYYLNFPSQTFSNNIDHKNKSFAFHKNKFMHSSKKRYFKQRKQYFLSKFIL